MPSMLHTAEIGTMTRWYPIPSSSGVDYPPSTLVITLLAIDNIRICSLIAQSPRLLFDGKATGQEPWTSTTEKGFI